MASILLLTENMTNACSYYRVAGITKDLRQKMPHDSIDLVEWSRIELHWGFLSQYNLIMIQRPYGKAFFELCSMIKNMNIPLWLDHDDYILQVPESNKTHWIYNKPENQEYAKKILALADVVTVTTEDLKTAYSEFSKNIVVIPNAFNDSIFPTRRILPERSNVVLWRGTDTHEFDLWKYARAINKATYENPDMQFLYLGYLPYFLNQEKGNVFARKDEDIMFYFRNSFNLNPAVLHVPLNDELFNRCKSNIAYIEGSYFGAGCLVPAFWDVEGALKYSNEQEYYNNLNALVSGQIDIKAMNKAAWEFICDTLALSKVNVKRVEIINSML